MIARQLPLALDPPARATFATYWPGPNRGPRDALAELARAPRDRWVALSGPAGAGKSHLLAATARAAVGGILLSGRKLRTDVGPTDLAELGTPPLVCVDDLHALLGDPGWERALFVLADALRGARSGFLFSAPVAPRELSHGLPDLGSRLCWGVHWRLGRLAEEDKAALLTERAHRMGIALDPATRSYMLERLPRDVGALLDGLDRVAQASLALKRRVTPRLVGEVLAARDDPGGARGARLP